MPRKASKANRRVRLPNNRPGRIRLHKPGYRQTAIYYYLKKQEQFAEGDYLVDEFGNPIVDENGNKILV